MSSEVPPPVSINITGNSNDSKFVLSSTSSTIDDQPYTLVKDSSHVVKEASLTTLQNDVNQIQATITQMSNVLSVFLSQNGSGDASGNGADDASGNGADDASGNTNVVVNDLLVSGTITTDYQLTITSKNVGNQILAGPLDQIWNCIWLLLPYKTSTQIQYPGVQQRELRITYNSQDYWLVAPLTYSQTDISWSSIIGEIFYTHPPLAPGEETVINLDVSTLKGVVTAYGQSEANFAYIGDSPYWDGENNVWKLQGEILEENDTSETTLSNNFFFFTVYA